MDYSARKNIRNKRYSRSKMKSTISIAVTCILTVSVCTAQPVELEIKKVLENQVAAWNADDIEGFMLGYWNSDSTVFNSGGALTKGWKEVFARYKKSYATKEIMGQLEFKDLVIRMISPSAAVAMGVWKLHRRKDQPWGRFTLIVENKPEGWRITHDHTSSANEK
jgi:ketosteroid isomerase-like protein